MSDEYDFDFNREDDGHVWATVELGYGFSIVVYSDEPTSPRDWVLDELEIPNAITSCSLKQPVAVPYATELGRALAKAWDRYVQNESRLPYAAGVTYGGNG